jgi:hypothetical protein
MLTNPVLHPYTDHRQAKRLHLLILLLNVLLSIDDTDHSPLLDPRGKWSHRADVLGQIFSLFHKINTMEKMTIYLTCVPVKHLVGVIIKIDDTNL